MPSKRTRWVKVGVWLLVAGILLTLQRCLYPWPKRLPNVRIEPTRPILRDADVKPDNAFFYLRQLTDAPRANYEWGNEYERFCSLGMQGGPYPALEARLTEIAGNLELCRQAAALPKCQVVTIDSAHPGLPYLAPVREVVRNLRFRAERAAAKGDWATVGNDCRLALRTGDHVSRGGGLYNHLVTYSCGSSTCGSLRRLTIDNEPPPEFLRGMIQVLDDLDRNPEPFAEAVRYERLLGGIVVHTVDNRASRAVELGGAGKSSPMAVTLDALSYYLLPLAGSTPRRTAAHLDAVYSHAIDIAAKRRPSGRSVCWETLGCPANRREPVQFIFDDPLGRFLVPMLVGGLDDAAEKHRQYVATLRGSELVLALRRYQRTHDGKLPARLEELVPDCLAAVPVDPFSPEGKTFVYRVDASGQWTISIGGPDLDVYGAPFWYFEYWMADEHRGRLELIFSASEPEQRRTTWYMEHPSESVDR